MVSLQRYPAAHAGGPEATLEHDQSSGNRLWVQANAALQL
jgi:hypothetical protein